MASTAIIVWFVMMITLLVFMNLKPLLVKGEQHVPCLFIMGDSTFDNGNNNNLLTAAKANYPPYGIDFPDGPTGRFTNGRNIADFIAEMLGFDKYIEPFATVKGVDRLKGVNYASGAAGNKTLTMEYLSKCIYIVQMGNNDYINNYLLPQLYPSSHMYKPEQFSTILIQQYSEQLKTLYLYGARKIVVFGLGGIGCVPTELDMYGTEDSACVNSIDSAVQKFSDKLKPMIDDLNSNLPNANFIYINSTSITVTEPSSVGITNLREPCCEISATKGEGQCKRGGDACSDRASHYFWDGFHPSEAPNKVTAERAYTALLSTDAYPFDISQLSQV